MCLDSAAAYWHEMLGNEGVRVELTNGNLTISTFRIPRNAQKILVFRIF